MEEEKRGGGSLDEEDGEGDGEEDRVWEKAREM